MQTSRRPQTQAPDVPSEIAGTSSTGASPPPSRSLAVSSARQEAGGGSGPEGPRGAQRGGQPTLRLQAAGDVRPGRVAVEAQHIGERGRRRGLPPCTQGHGDYSGDARLEQGPADVQEEEGEPVGVHGGLAGAESGASALIYWVFAAAQPRPPSLGKR